MRKHPSQLPEPNARPPMPQVERARASADAADFEDRMMIAAIAMHALLSNYGSRVEDLDKLADTAVRQAGALLARLNRDSQAAGFGA